MRSLGARILPAAAVTLVIFTGCSGYEGVETRYRAEHMAWQARREEQRLAMRKSAPDSATLLRIRAEYSRLRETFRPPFIEGSGTNVNLLRRDIARVVGASELTASQRALLAHRPDLALESARWVATIAGADTGLHREADFGAVTALRDLKRYDEAILTMRELLDRYPPVPPPTPDREDQILSVPDALIQLRSEMGDSEGVKKEQAAAVAYYRHILDQKPPPYLESQVRARLSRTLLEMDQGDAAFAEVKALRRLVSATPGLKALEPELLYSEARIRGMAKDNKAALDLYDLVVMTHPSSPFAARSLLDAAVISERVNDRAGAVARYRAILDRQKIDPQIAPVALFRMAMVKDQMGNWPEAKQALESIPLQFPKSRGAVEAPFAIVDHYMRVGQREDAKRSLASAVDTYRAMIARDTTSAYCPIYRWNILRAYTALERWNNALATVDEMAEKDRGAPITAEALFQGARIARTIGNKSKSDSYLQRIVREYPESPFAGPVRKLLKQSAGASAGGDEK
ncbi:MAG TPA: tetratricopeptide repeat protein [Candidatus Limnocylindrales bacterium]|nr:tetratricopeptide repeat protein [Candidatus Limnocylindrales bacterium]